MAEQKVKSLNSTVLSSFSGLSNAEAEIRLQQEGPNELGQSRRKPFLFIVFETLKEPMTLLLLAAGCLYYVLGDPQEATVLMSFVLLLIVITVAQNTKTEQALTALKELTSPRASVIRENQQKKIPGREVVRGDIILLQEGDRVPADGVLLESTNLFIDESLLTGESIPVRKANSHSPSSDQTLSSTGENASQVFSGSLVIGGQGLFEVTATGSQTEFGKIGKSLQAITPEKSILQQEIHRIVILFATIGISLCLLLITVYGLTRHDWLQAVLAGITLAMSIMPEEFPVVFMLFMSLGAWRLSKHHVLIRQVSAVETLGAATVICTDKTGTLTQNKMRVELVSLLNESFTLAHYNNSALSEPYHEVIEFSILASKPNPFDPMEIAFKVLGDQYLTQTKHLHSDWQLIQEYPLSDSLLAMSQVWGSPDKNHYIIAAKGSPEAILDLCHLDNATFAKATDSLESMAKQGLRVLGVAKAIFNTAPLPEGQHDFAFEFLGFVGLSDPIREDVPQALAECDQAGIRVMMITGDYPLTAQNIATKAGFKNIESIMTGKELATLSDQELEKKVTDITIFSRILPEQKLRIVNALKANGEIVAMAGDGVNDAPALKAAHIGIAMGSRGTDVAREASAMVLTTDDFASIVQAIKIGRRIFHNLRKTIAYLLAIHIPIAGLSLIPVLLGWPLILLPIHIACLHLIVDPACSVVFEVEEPEADIMRQPPRKKSDPILNRQTVWMSGVQGFSILLTTLGIFAIALQWHHSVNTARAMTFSTLIVANLSVIITNRSWSSSFITLLKTPNKAMYWVIGIALSVLGMALFIPPVQKMFRFGPLHLNDLFLCLMAGLICILWFDLLKRQSKSTNPVYNVENAFH